MDAVAHPGHDTRTHCDVSKRPTEPRCRATAKRRGDLLIAEILLYEAEATINGKKNPADEPTTPLENSVAMPAEKPSKAG